MIQTTNESPTVWSVDELMARLDTDCFLYLRGGVAEVISVDDPDSVEATMSGDDLGSLLDSYNSRLRRMDLPARFMNVLYGSANERMAAYAESQNQTRH